MVPVFDYVLKLSIGLTVVYLFYQLLLRRLTYYKWNRLYLISFSIVCFCFPVIDIHALLEKNELGQAGLVSFIPSVHSYTDALVQVTQCPVPGTGWDKWDWMAIVFIAGIFILLARFFMRMVSFALMKANAELLYQDGMKLYQVNQPIRPFSFGNAVFINRHMHTSHELQEIICHEFVHVKQRHTFDIIFGELLCILNWYNPFAWLIRKAIRQNLEFIADQQVLQTGFDRKQYQYLLLKVVGESAYSIANNFNFSSLKKRIAMMNKTKSTRMHLMRFAFILPLLVIVLVAFRNTTHQPVSEVNTIVVDTLPTPKTGLPDNVKGIHNRNNKVTVTLKNGNREYFDLSNPDEKEAFENKYGALPAPPPPPAAPLTGDAVTALPSVPAPPPPAAFNEDCYNKKGYCITIADNKGECVVIVKDKNKKIVEAIALTDWNKDKKYEQKYGELSPPPPPAPPTPPTPPAAPVKEVRANSVSVKAHSSQAVAVSAALTEPVPVAPVVAASADLVEPVSVIQVAATEQMVPVAEAEKDENVVVFFSSATNKAGLEKLKEQVKKKGFTLTFSDMKFKDGKLVLVEGTITNGDKKASFKGEDFNKIIISYIKNDKGAGFNVGIYSGKELS